MAESVQLYQVVSRDPFKGRTYVTTHKTEGAARNEFRVRERSRHLDARIVPGWTLQTKGAR